mmetsp:Transcript_7146/g.14492  ORF Transcript_7146/g.14492 Transcript_7146/m.14492 type:complete len:236 (-) Transcript_7146:662-1369(-)
MLNKRTASSPVPEREQASYFGHRNNCRRLMHFFPWRLSRSVGCRRQRHAAGMGWSWTTIDHYRSLGLDHVSAQRGLAARRRLQRIDDDHILPVHIQPKLRHLHREGGVEGVAHHQKVVVSLHGALAGEERAGGGVLEVRPRLQHGLLPHHPRAVHRLQPPRRVRHRPVPGAEPDGAGALVLDANAVGEKEVALGGVAAVLHVHAAHLHPHPMRDPFAMARHFGLEDWVQILQLIP